MNRQNGISSNDASDRGNEQNGIHSKTVWSSANTNKSDSPPKSPAEELYDKWAGFVSRLFRQMTAKERFLYLAGFFLSGIVAFFAAEKGIPFLPMETDSGLLRPLGDAILASSGRFAPAAYMALIYQAYTSGAEISRYVLLTVLFAIRTAVALWMREDGGYEGFYRESVSLKLGSVTAFSLLALGITLPSVKLELSTLPSILAPILMSPVITLGISGFFDPPPVVTEINKRRSSILYRELSTYFFFILCVYSCQGYKLFGSSLSSLCAMFLTVVTATRSGTVRGAVLGTTLGFAVSPAYAPVLAITGIFAGALSGLGIGAAVGISCAAGCAVSIYAYGYQAILTHVPESIIATALTAPIVKYGFLPDGFPFLHGRKKQMKGILEREADVSREKLCTHSLREVSEAFGKLADSPYATDVTGCNGAPSGDYVCARLKEGFCDTCPLVCICWDNGNKLAASAVKLTVERLYSVDRERRRLPSPMRASDGFKCIRPAEIERDILRICETPEARATATTPEPIGFFRDCEYLADILSDIADRCERSTVYDTASSARAVKAAARLGLAAEDVAVFGDRSKTLVAYGADGALNEEQLTLLKNAFGTACDTTFASPFAVTEARRSRLIFKSRPLYTAEYACAQGCSPDEERNGDSTACFFTDDERFYSLICDGMGSGEEAAECSETAIFIMQKLLTHGAEPRTAAKLTGNAVSRRESECFTTLDLLQIDLMTGSASLLKCGAACSFLLRDGDVKALSAPSMPLGIVGDLSAEQIPLSLKENDTVVMISDGVAQDDADEYRFTEHLLALADTDPEQMANSLLEAVIGDYETARRHGASGEEREKLTEPESESEASPDKAPSTTLRTPKTRRKRDDMTVTVVRIKGK